MTASPEPVTTESCCACGSIAVVYHNYRQLPFCASCANGDPPRRHGVWLPPAGGGVVSFILSYLFAHLLHLPLLIGGPIAAAAGALVILAGTTRMR